MTRTAFLFASHKLTDFIIEQYYRLRKATECFGDLYLLIENGDTKDIPKNITYYSFDVDTLNELGYEPIAETIVPGSNHFQVLQFFKEYPFYDYYWNIEYDVYFNGDWQELFTTYKDIDIDFISSHVKPYAENPSWIWWKNMQLKTLTILPEDYIRSFNPIYRISNKALKRLDEELCLENSGHHEAFIPTVLYHAGCTIGDFGQSDSFSIPQVNKVFYNQGSGDSDIRCSMRYRPLYNKKEIKEKGENNLFYHPIKE